MSGEGRYKRRIGASPLPSDVEKAKGMKTIAFSDTAGTVIA